MKKISASANPSLLRDQLLAALQPQVFAGAGAAEDEEANLWRFRIPLRLILGEAWRCAARSDFTTHRELLRILVEAQDLVRPDLPDQGPPEAEAAREVHYATWMLHVAEVFLRPAKTEARLRDQRRSASERKILRVLLENKEKYLRRKEIEEELERLLPPPRPTPTRISQILSNLWEERLLTRMQGSAQGNPQTSFFALSALGLQLCQGLGLADPRPPFEWNEERWRHLLRRAELAANPDRQEGRERIAAFYRPRPGVGCSLTLAHCAVALAEDLRGKHRVLVLDLEGEESSLPDHLRVDKLEAHRGLAGLFEDYQAQSENERRGWLESSLCDERYACRVPGREGLFYLPALEHKQGTDLSAAYAALLQSLRLEIERQPRSGDGAPKAAGEGFLGDLRETLRNARACAKTLIQAPCGLGPGAYLACVLLAEELILFLRPEDPWREGTRKVLREVVGNALRRREADPGIGMVPVFVFTRLSVEAEFNPDAAIDHLLVDWTEEDLVRDDLVYRIVRLHEDERLRQEATLLDLAWDRSLLGEAYLNLIEILHPDSSFSVSQYKRQDEELEMRREQAVQEKQFPVTQPTWNPPPVTVSVGSGYGSSIPAAPQPAAAPPLSRRSWRPDPRERELPESIDAALRNAELSRAMNLAGTPW